MNRTKGYLAIAAVLGSCFMACNYTDGECFPREELYETAGVGGGPIVPTGVGVGGYGQVPFEPQNEPPEPPLGEGECNAMVEARCLVPASDACVEQCHAIKAYCVHRAAHPYSPSSGIGDLYWCKGGWPSYTCSYQYSNGDNCTLIYPIGKWLCRYDFEKK
ncbi:hypothetical protein [Polyangium spumosum]|uniref:Uncharacterized protein n=1 Tax=Polyangium spumosum TaxID=889282 RepID=A0A6N7PZA6_9BACT|nr:hypothetical protein [Polyangium spumosum]MRG96887.1 hypothetical protein [Polyangium spumosum]